MAACSAATLLQSGKSLQALDAKQLELVEIALLMEWLGETLTPAVLLERGKCWACLDKKEMDMAYLQLLCNMT